MLSCKFDCNTEGPEWAFRKLMRAHRLAHDAVFESLGLREIGQPVLLFVLGDLRRSGEKCTQKELAEFLDLSPSTITISVNSLEKRGLIRRVGDTADKRRKFVEISDKGVAVAEKCRLAFDGIDRAMYEGFSPGEQENAARSFARMAANLQKCAKEAEKC